MRKNTYLVAVKASRMENSANYPGWREEELDEVLVKITENDADFCSTRSRKRLNNSQQTARFQLMFCKNADCKLLDDPTHTLLSDKLQKNFHFKSSDY